MRNHAINLAFFESSANRVCQITGIQRDTFYLQVGIAHAAGPGASNTARNHARSRPSHHPLEMMLRAQRDPGGFSQIDLAVQIAFDIGHRFVHPVGMVHRIPFLVV